MKSALKFITCGSVDDGKSTLIGRLLVDGKAVLQDQLSSVQRMGTTDLALLTDGLQAEREQGITIDVAWRYFATPARKFIIGDCPGHEQYTRNMVTAASQAHAAVVLVDATKLDWKGAHFELLAQTKRHSLLLQLLRVPHIIYAVNKLDALGSEATAAFTAIKTKLLAFTKASNIAPHAIVPISALLGHNVVHSSKSLSAVDIDWCGYGGESLLSLLENLHDVGASDTTYSHFSASVQWVEKQAAAAHTHKGRRILWTVPGRGAVAVGDNLAIFSSGQTAVVAQIFTSTRDDILKSEGSPSLGLVLDRELDVSRGDWLQAASNPLASTTSINATLAWFDDVPAVEGRVYWALHGHKWVKAKLQKIDYQLDVNTLTKFATAQLNANAIAQVQLVLQSPVPTLGYTESRLLGSFILVDCVSNNTAGAALIGNYGY